ncbi:MAG: dihydropyrimidinase [Clostridiales Family XIII bacterium]|jgi:dihydropyrimidinase|nr:dihydropyrimidinase [Clostridiales Family XIII bacterium]
MLIRGGILVGERDVFLGDLRTDADRIEEVAEKLVERPGEETIDASGLYVLPGGIDVHTHFDLDVGFAHASDDFYTGTVAAACGGTTTIIDHPGFGPQGCSLHHQIDLYHRLAEGKAVIDYGFHGVIQHVDDEIFRELAELRDEGITSFKFYTTYDYRLHDDGIFRLLRVTRDLGLLPAVHCENHEMLTFLRNEWIREGKCSPHWHPKSRPQTCEGEAVSRVLALAEEAGNAPIYIVHLSTEIGVEMVGFYRRRGHQTIFAETCPQYLLLDESKYDLPGDEGLKYILSPPLRKPRDCNALWSAVSSRRIDTVATDHCSFRYSVEKQLGKDDFTKCPNGMPGVEARMSLLFSEGVLNGRMSARHFAALTSENPAKRFGLYPRKGVLKAGSDADIVLIDPEITWTMKQGFLHENVDYTPYEEIPVQGKPVMTISRGEIVMRDGAFVGRKGRGIFLKRDLPIFARSEK